MSEVQGSQDADTEPVAAAPARCEAPAWVGEAPGAYFRSEELGLIGWCNECGLARDYEAIDIHMLTHHVPSGPTLFHTPELRLSPLAVHALCTGASYVDVFKGAELLQSVHTCAVGSFFEHVVWGTFPFHKTQEPVLRNLIVADQPVAPSEINKCLKTVRGTGGTK